MTADEFMAWRTLYTHSHTHFYKYHMHAPRPVCKSHTPANPLPWTDQLARPKKKQPPKMLDIYLYIHLYVWKVYIYIYYIPIYIYIYSLQMHCHVLGNERSVALVAGVCLPIYYIALVSYILEIVDPVSHLALLSQYGVKKFIYDELQVRKRVSKKCRISLGFLNIYIYMNSAVQEACGRYVKHVTHPYKCSCRVASTLI